MPWLEYITKDGEGIDWVQGFTNTKILAIRTGFQYGYQFINEKDVTRVEEILKEEKGKAGLGYVLWKLQEEKRAVSEGRFHK